MTHVYWLQWITAFLIVVALLTVAAGAVEYWKWRKENR